MTTNAPNATQRVSDLVEGYWSTQVIAAAVRLGAPDKLDAAKDAATLARDVGAHAWIPPSRREAGGRSR